MVPQQFNDSLFAEVSLESSTEFNIDTPLVWVVGVVCSVRPCFGGWWNLERYETVCAGMDVGRQRVVSLFCGQNNLGLKDNQPTARSSAGGGGGGAERTH